MLLLSQIGSRQPPRHCERSAAIYGRDQSDCHVATAPRNDESHHYHVARMKQRALNLTGSNLNALSAALGQNTWMYFVIRETLPDAYH